MGEFHEICQRIAGMIEESRGQAGGVSARDIPEIVSQAIGRGLDAFNCYPGVPGTGCHDLALFISLGNPLVAKGRDHLNFRNALHKIVQHMQGSCLRATRHAILFTDCWDATAYEEWKSNIQQIAKSANFEAYLVVGACVTLMSI